MWEVDQRIACKRECPSQLQLSKIKYTSVIIVNLFVYYVLTLPKASTAVFYAHLRRQATIDYFHPVLNERKRVYNKCLKMLREVKVRLAEMEGEACLYEAVVAVLRDDDDA